MPARTSVELHTDGYRIGDVVARQTRGNVHVRAFVPNLPRDEPRRRRSGLVASLRQARTDHKLAKDASSSRMKVLGGIDITGQRMPQDGRISQMVNGRRVDLGVATFPTTYGEKWRSESSRKRSW
jgi:hypothetical protein